jgi:phosphoribosylglycinamide formyltransferase-1
MPDPFRLAVLLSGSGSTLENLYEKRDAGQLPVEVCCVASSRADAFGLERAQRRGTPSRAIPRRAYASPSAFSDAVFEYLDDFQPDLVALAGFMSFLAIPPRYENKLVNVHPSLLPAFGGQGCYGMHVHEKVLAYGCKVSGCTVHFVDHEYDHGPIICQRAVEVAPDETPASLAEKVQAAEREVYPEAIARIASGQVRLDGRRVLIGG